mgnify:CR=1 FL=1
MEHKSRFSDEFGVEEEDSDSYEHAIAKKSSKPADYNALFDGNNDDHFRIGVKFTRFDHNLWLWIMQTHITSLGLTLQLHCSVFLSIQLILPIHTFLLGLFWSAQNFIRHLREQCKYAGSCGDDLCV